MLIFADYEGFSTKRAARRLDIWFLHACEREGVTPGFAKVRISNSKVSARQRDRLQRSIIKGEICRHYSTINQLDCKLKILFNKIVNDQASNLTFNDFLGGLDDRIRIFKNNKFNKLSGKLNRLIVNKQNRDIQMNNNKKISDFVFHERIKNLSGVEFSVDETDILSLGLKHCLKPSIQSRDFLFFAVEMDVAIENISRDLKVKTSLRNEIFDSLYTIKKGKENE